MYRYGIAKYKNMQVHFPVFTLRLSFDFADTVSKLCTEIYTVSTKLTHRRRVKTGVY